MEDPGELYRAMYNAGHMKTSPKFYRAWAAYLEAHSRTAEARRVLASQPADLAEFEARHAAAEDAKEPEAPWEPILLGAASPVRRAFPLGVVSPGRRTLAAPSGRNMLTRIGGRGENAENEVTAAETAGRVFVPYGGEPGIVLPAPMALTVFCAEEETTEEQPAKPHANTLRERM